jgi:hypothetical protein
MRCKPVVPKLIACLVLAVCIGPASADVRILASPGGEVGRFLRLFAALRESGQRIIIDGPCFSACTLVLGSIPRERICVTNRAILGFHGARLFDREGNEYRTPSSVNADVMDAYPKPVQRWIRHRGGLSGKMITLRGAELLRYYPRCV